MKFHAGEHVPEAIVLGLRRRGFDGTTTVEANLRSVSDEQQLAFCQTEDRVMVSHDADMVRLAVAGVPNAGIVYCHNQKYVIGEMLLKLLALARHIATEDMRGQVEFLLIGGMQMQGIGLG